MRLRIQLRFHFWYSYNCKHTAMVTMTMTLAYLQVLCSFPFGPSCSCLSSDADLPVILDMPRRNWDLEIQPEPRLIIGVRCRGGGRGEVFGTAQFRIPWWISRGRRWSIGGVGVASRIGADVGERGGRRCRRRILRRILSGRLANMTLGGRGVDWGQAGGSGGSLR